MLDVDGSDTVARRHSRVLLIEDDPLDARLVREMIREADASMEVVHVTTVGAATSHLHDTSIDAVLLDLNLPDLSGLKAVAAVQAECTGQPILVLTGRSESDLALEAIRLGAQDYLFKDTLDSRTLYRAMRHGIARQRMLACMRDTVRTTSSSESDLRQLVLQGTEALLVVGAGGQVHFANELAERLFGREDRDLTTRPFETGAAPGIELEIEIVRPDGSHVQAEIRSVNVMWRNEPALLVSLRDVSERRQASEQQVRFEMLTGFLNNMSHELRTPLAAVYQFVSNVRDGVLGPVTDEQGEHLGSALRNVDEALSMVTNLLEVARSQGGKLRVEPHVMQLEAEILPLCETLAIAAQKSGVRFVTDVPDSLPSILADPVRVRQIIANLVENAIKFTPEDGTVSVRARHDPESRRVVVVVTDTGCGVPAEHLDRIFDKLHQVPDTVYHTRRGLGLGLYITRELVRGLGGSIYVKSEPGQGSQFEIALPTFTWESATAALGEFAKPALELYALVVSAGWSEDDSGEPIPGGPIAMIRTLTEQVVDAHPHSIVPPIVTGSVLRLGAIVALKRRPAESLLRILVGRMQTEPSLANSGLKLRVQLVRLAATDQENATPDFSKALDRCFKRPNLRGARCKARV